MELLKINFETWKKLDTEIKLRMYQNGLTPESITTAVDGELEELVIKTSFGSETLFYGNGEAIITVDVNGLDYEFAYVVDTYNGEKFIVNF